MKNNEIDQKQLKRTRLKFLNLGERRFKRMESSLSPTQADYLKLIPLLFHVNHPMLPGYVDKFVPCGLPNYTPTALEKKIAKAVSKSFEYKQRAYLKYPIASLYLMGSMGTLGQSNSSDIDLWICLSDQFEQGLTSKLRAKADKISDWFNNIGIELNCYLVNLDDFSRNKTKTIGVDNCGNTQNYLLLDEFYRTAVWFAGKWILWWVVPTDQDYVTYAKKLVIQKHIDASDWIDFGPVKQIPVIEYFSAAVWQLYKSIESPYKSAVKLLLLEIYARSGSNSATLSDEFKHAVYQSCDMDEDFDPYLFMLVFVEKALLDIPQRLEFLRRAFYLKAQIKIKQERKHKPSWRYSKILELVKRWEWNQLRLDSLNNRHQWTIRRVAEERTDLVRELNHSYHFLANFARSQGVVKDDIKKQLLSLGRKLYAAFERHSGKIEKLNCGITKSVSEQAVTLSEDNLKGWSFYLGHIEQSKLVIHQSVFSARSLFECLCWGCVNGVIIRSTGCHVYQLGEYLNHQLANEMIRDIMSLLSRFRLYDNKSMFDSEPKTSHIGVYINTRSDPLEVDKKKNLYRIATNSDCFCWTDNKTNLASHFDAVSINSWGEITTKYYSGEGAWIDFFDQQQEYFIAGGEISVFCRGIVQKELVIERVQDLLALLRGLLQNSRRFGRLNRYIMAVGKRVLMVDLLGSCISYSSCSSWSKFYIELSKSIDLEKWVNRANSKQSKEVRIKYHTDSFLQIEPFVNMVLKRRLTESLDFFVYQKSKTLVEVMVKSKVGYLHYQSHKNVNIEQIIGHYQQFFDKIKNRNLINNELLETVHFYKFSVSTDGLSKRVIPIKINSTSLLQQFSLVQAIATQKHVFSAGFDLFTDESHYYYAEHSEEVYLKLRSELMNLRDQGNNYPIFLTDLDISSLNSKATIIEYLSYKKMIEVKLNRN